MGTIDAALSALNNCIPSICLLLQILAVEVRQPPCQLAKEDSRHLETHLLGKIALAVQLKKPMKMGWHCGTPRKRPKFGLRFLCGFEKSAFRYGANLIFNKAALLWARVPVLRVYASQKKSILNPTKSPWHVSPTWIPLKRSKVIWNPMKSQWYPH